MPVYWVGRCRLVLLAVLVALVTIASCGTNQSAARIPDQPPTTGPTTEDRRAAESLAVRTIPEGSAVAGMSPLIDDEGVRIRVQTESAASAVLCDAGNQAQLPAESDMLATAAASYRNAGQSLYLSASVMQGDGSDDLLGELEGAVEGCDDNPLSTMSDVRLGELDGVRGVVYRATVQGQPTDFRATCAIARDASMYLRSCALSSQDNPDRLAKTGQDLLRSKAEEARRAPTAPVPVIAPQPPSWMAAVQPSEPRAEPDDVCALLAEADIESATGRTVQSFQPDLCRWTLDAGAVSLSENPFSQNGPLVRGVLRGNDSYQANEVENTCHMGVIFFRQLSLDVTVAINVPGRRPCEAARQLLTRAFDRLPTP